MFPKLAETPLNGAEITPENLLGDGVRLEPEQAVGEDVYANLVERRRRMKRIMLRKQAREKACRERSVCCEKPAARNPEGESLETFGTSSELMAETTSAAGEGANQC